MRLPSRANATASSTSGMSVMHTGQPGPMMTSRSRGKTARRPKRAMACSWLPHTCITRTGEWPTARTSRSSAAPSALARAGSRNLSSAKGSATASPSGNLPPRRHLAADVGGHEVALAGLLEDGVEEGQGLPDLLGRDAPDGEAHVVEHVVAGLHRLVHDVQSELLHHAEEVHAGGEPVHRED